MMNKEIYLKEVEKRLQRIFQASREGYRATAVERHRLEGFMQAGVYLKLVSNAELEVLMENIHQRIFGKTIQQRKAESSRRWQEEVIDYSQYDQPSYERKDN